MKLVDWLARLGDRVRMSAEPPHPDHDFDFMPLTIMPVVGDDTESRDVSETWELYRGFVVKARAQLRAEDLGAVRFTSCCVVIASQGHQPWVSDEQDRFWPRPGEALADALCRARVHIDDKLALPQIETVQ